MHPITLRLPVRMLPQPDETTCGPTCLQAVYNYWGGDVPLADVSPAPASWSTAATSRSFWPAMPCARATRPRSTPTT